MPGSSGSRERDRFSQRGDMAAIHRSERGEEAGGGLQRDPDDRVVVGHDPVVTGLGTCDPVVQDREHQVVLDRPGREEHAARERSAGSSVSSTVAPMPRWCPQTPTRRTRISRVPDVTGAGAAEPGPAARAFSAHNLGRGRAQTEGTTPVTEAPTDHRRRRARAVEFGADFLHFPRSCGRVEEPVGYRGKVEEQARARELRAEGKLLADIAAELGVSKSSVSLWVRDVDFTPSKRRYGPQRRPNRLHDEKLRQIDAARSRRASSASGSLTDDAFLAAGAALYAGEGSKGDGKVRVREH